MRKLLGPDPNVLYDDVTYCGDGSDGHGSIFSRNDPWICQKRYVVPVVVLDSSAPLALRPILALIDVISYFVRPVSHSIRLAGNMMAGHAVIKVFAAFAGVAVIAPLSVLAITAIYALEMLVSFIQAYVFAILTCVYLKDALHPHH